ncbi:hypothetical protein O77CONTIG1_01268 [Leptolyngbya sp. O-77]|nr:hypothetical protein O77CONTIG1_01268 [Leptolyngbya sp. O-77]
MLKGFIKQTKQTVNEELEWWINHQTDEQDSPMLPLMIGAF